MNDVADDLQKLKTLNLEISQRLEKAELHIDSANSLLERLAATGLTSERIYLGDVILRRPYSDRWEPSGSGEVVQAALSTPCGFGAVFWDSEELFLLSCTQQEEQEAIRRHVHFSQSAPAIKALLLPQFEPLLKNLLQDLERLWPR